MTEYSKESPMDPSMSEASTPLDDAVERDFVSPTPDSPAGLLTTDAVEKKSHKKAVITTAVLLAGAAVTAAALFGFKSGAEPSKNAPPAPNPKATSQTPEASPSAVEKGPNLAELVAAQEIKSGQTGETLAPDINTKFNNWIMAGTDTFPADYKSFVAKTGDASDASFSKFADDYAKKQYTDIYGPALFGTKPGEVVDPALQSNIDNFIRINSNTLQINYITSDDKTPYTRSLTLNGFRGGNKAGDNTTISVDATGNTSVIQTQNHLNDAIGIWNDKLTFTTTLHDNGNNAIITKLSIDGR